MWEFFSQKTIFVTGGTGSLGTAVVLRPVSQARPKCIYLLCREGKHWAAQKWQKILPKPMSDTLISSDLITYLDGDIQKPDLALPPQPRLHSLKTTTEIIIHAASSINLVDPLHKLSQSIIGATERLAHFALSCPHLHRFVYISSAFANSLYAEASSRAAVDVSVRETLYPLHQSPSSSSPSISTATTYKELQSRGTTTEYESQPHDIPWLYAYAKQRSERVLLQTFNHDQNHNHNHVAFPNNTPIHLRPGPELPLPGLQPILMSTTNHSSNIGIAYPLNPVPSRDTRQDSRHGSYIGRSARERGCGCCFTLPTGVMASCTPPAVIRAGTHSNFEELCRQHLP
ncbi:hypothetical protein AnigIFM59636_008854 [Aspergillus niger]|nr:hypothetical protein AnigIFM59636_008854 [Aspergillus niger]